MTTEALQHERTRTWEEEAQMLLSLLDCLILDQDAVYASSEFTTGRRFYQLCRKYGVRSGKDLKDKLGREYDTQLLVPNRDEGIRFARRLKKLGHPLVLTPNPFHADPLNRRRNWTQQQYLEFWKIVIQQKCHAVYFNEGWQSSNGCTYEYLTALEIGRALFDHEGQRLDAARAAEMIAEAIRSLEAEGFDVPGLREVYLRLTSLQAGSAQKVPA